MITLDIFYSRCRKIIIFIPYFTHLLLVAECSRAQDICWTVNGGLAGLKSIPPLLTILTFLTTTKKSALVVFSLTAAAREKRGDQLGRRGENSHKLSFLSLVTEIHLWVIKPLFVCCLLFLIRHRWQENTRGCLQEDSNKKGSLSGSVTDCVCSLSAAEAPSGSVNDLCVCKVEVTAEVVSLGQQNPVFCLPELLTGVISAERDWVNHHWVSSTGDTAHTLSAVWKLWRWHF